MTAKSRRKGKVGEREAAEILSAVYPDARRGYHQSRKGSDAPDVIGTPWWVEVEMSAAPSPHRKMRQAIEASGVDGPDATIPPTTPPLVMTRQCSRSRSGPWLVTMRAEDFIALCEDAEAVRRVRGAG